ncbi:hypothetical protein Q765_03310 [Flavobacterium rivuli WB 3.3-2 = DSM 21788]|uniref:Uncharacterized protein n=1 Tax=Flavobacterium rivuli WB 3.3-2 = DSM 21788 TaxID=1121895 RepID=A0A0A2M8Y3_9FLAO|nr:hypothetical protein [Flavobacterium rivuli]KGO88096.1 hypothetical protein Q765_03310 [Flavobacterium rivuli WB 3.3-2 = DSM 21788]
MDIDTIRSGKTTDGVRYLELFLKEYISIFGGTVNAGCPKCLTDYLNRYKNHMKTTNNTSGYKLLAKYQNIPLEFGSQILVNDENITKEYADILLSQPGGHRFFLEQPDLNSKATLEANLKAAEDKLANLSDKARAKTREAATAAVDEAKAALDAFVEPQTPADVEDLSKVVITLEDDDFVTHPELTEQGHKVGDSVIVDAEKFNGTGEIEAFGLENKV